jgi:hypothetical protein
MPDEIDEKLEACPFCGGEASSDGHISYSKPLSGAWWADGSDITEAFYVICVRCGATARGGLVGGFQTKAEAVAAWNTRTLPSPVNQDEAGVERVIFEFVREVNEYDDRTSPEDWPEALLITSEELSDLLHRFASALSIMSPRPAGGEEVEPDLIERLLDAQQDINYAANCRMDQSLCAAAALIDEIEPVLRRALTKPTALPKEGETHPVFAFLLGTGPLDGLWFGDKPNDRAGAYWWRRHLRAALSSLPVSGEVDWRAGLKAAFDDKQTLTTLAFGVKAGAFPLTDQGQISWSEWLIERIESRASAALNPQPQEGE